MGVHTVPSNKTTHQRQILLRKSRTMGGADQNQPYVAISYAHSIHPVYPPLNRLPHGPTDVDAKTN